MVSIAQQQQHCVLKGDATHIEGLHQQARRSRRIIARVIVTEGCQVERNAFAVVHEGRCCCVSNDQQLKGGMVSFLFNEVQAVDAKLVIVMGSALHSRAFFLRERLHLGIAMFGLHVRSHQVVPELLFVRGGGKSFESVVSAGNAALEPLVRERKCLAEATFGCLHGAFGKK